MCGMAFAHLRVMGMAFPWVDFTWAGSQAADLAEWAMGVNGTVLRSYMKLHKLGGGESTRSCKKRVGSRICLKALPTCKL